MSKKLIALGVTIVTVTAFMVFSVFNALALEFGSSGGSGMTSAVKLCKVARKSYRRDIKDARAKGLSLQLSKKEISDMVREIKTYRNKICKEAKKKKKRTMTSGSTAEAETTISISSTAFEGFRPIPLKHAFTEVTGGQNISPRLDWTVTNPAIKSFALLMYDPHPTAQYFVHWCVTRISADTRSLEEGVREPEALLLEGGGQTREPMIEWSNGYTKGYEGPYPPPEDDAHPYVFEIFGLNTADVNPRDTSGYCTYNSFKAAIADKIVAQGGIEGTFDR